MNSKTPNLLNTTLSVIAGAIMAACFYRESSIPNGYKIALSLALLMLGSFVIYKALTLAIIPSLAKLTRPKVLATLSVATLVFAAVAAASLKIGKTSIPQSLNWKLDAGPNKGKDVPPVENLSWQKRVVGAMALHASDNNQDPNTQWEWRATALTPEEIKQNHDALLNFEVTKPEWSVFDQSGQPAKGYDGVSVSILGKNGGTWQQLAQTHVDPFKNADQRQWITIEAVLAQGSEQIAVEVFPGPPGSNSYNDSLLIHLVSIKPFNHFTSSLKGVLLGISVAILSLVLILGIRALIAEDDASLSGS